MKGQKSGPPHTRNIKSKGNPGWEGQSTNESKLPVLKLSTLEPKNKKLEMHQITDLFNNRKIDFSFQLFFLLEEGSKLHPLSNGESASICAIYSIAHWKKQEKSKCAFREALSSLLVINTNQTGLHY